MGVLRVLVRSSKKARELRMRSAAAASRAIVALPFAMDSYSE